MSALYPIPSGLFCVPAAIAALTGADIVSVINPAINRHSRRRDTLIGTVAGVAIPAIEATLTELDYPPRRYRQKDLRAHVATWAARAAEKYPGRAILLCTRTHCLLTQDGRVYDNWCPHGPRGEEHPFAKTTVTYAALVERRVS